MAKKAAVKKKHATKTKNPISKGKYSNQNKVISPKVKPKLSKFESALFDELKLIRKELSDQALIDWIKKTPVGQCSVKAYNKLHG